MPLLFGFSLRMRLPKFGAIAESDLIKEVIDGRSRTVVWLLELNKHGTKPYSRLVDNNYDHSELWCASLSCRPPVTHVRPKAPR